METSGITGNVVRISCPHSLGTLIEWKLVYIFFEFWLSTVYPFSPHSLGTLIEWKLDRSMLTEFLAIEESPLAGDIN